jgi:hypothetical protein
MRARHLIIACLLLIPATARAQWWSSAPRDYEDCVAQVERSGVSKDVRASQLADCDSKFAGRRKPGGGYTYYDFMQDKHFDIAGPNPTPEELKRFDEEYTVYLERQRHDAIVAALTDKQRQEQQALEVQAAIDRAPVNAAPPPPRPPRIAARVHHPVQAQAKVRTQRPKCETPLSCTWTNLSESVRGLFSPPPPTKTRPPAKI